MVTQFKIILISNSYLEYISRCGTVKLPTPTFANNNVTQIMINFLAVGKITQRNGCNDLYLLLKATIMGLKSSLYLMSISRRDLIYLSTPTFLNINLTQTISNLLTPNLSKMAEIMSAFKS